MDDVPTASWNASHDSTYGPHASYDDATYAPPSSHGPPCTRTRTAHARSTHAAHDAPATGVLRLPCLRLPLANGVQPHAFAWPRRLL